jgi:hypothetical protein
MNFQEEVNNVMVESTNIDNEIKRLETEKSNIQEDFIKSKAKLVIGRHYMVTFPYNLETPVEIVIEKISIESVTILNIKYPGPVFASRWDIQYIGPKVHRRKDGVIKKVQPWSVPNKINHSELDKYIIEPL